MNNKSSIPNTSGLCVFFLLFFLAAPVLAAGDTESMAITQLNEAQLNSPEAIRDVVSGLSDEEVRSLLLERLDVVAKGNQSVSTAAQDAGVGAFFRRWGGGVAESVSLAVAALPNLYSGQKRVIETFINSQGEAGILRALAMLFLALGLGLMAERLVPYVTRRWRERIANPVDPDSYKESLQLLGLRFMLDMAGLIVFIIVTALVIENFQSKTADDFSFLVANNLIFFPRLMLAISRFVLAPKQPDLRIVHTDNQTASFLHQHQFGLFMLMGLGAAWLEFNRINGAIPGELRLGFWLGLSIYIYFIYIAWQARSGLREMLSGWENEGSSAQSWVARFYPGFLIVMAILIWLIIELIVSYEMFHLLRYSPANVTLVLLLFIPAFDTIIRGIVKYMMPPMVGSGVVAEQAYLSSKRSFIRIGRILLFGLALLIMAFIWQVRPHDIAARGVGSSVATHIIQLLIILSIGYLIWELVTLWINRKLAAEQTAEGIDLNSEEPGGGEGGGTGSSRLSTILPLVRSTLQAIIIVMTVLIALSNIGINITPLLAGAGVVGIAVGFGAQKLVQDVVSGIFFLIDDAFRQGEYISIEGTLGTVEKISLRSMQLRHHRGAVHTIPYGEIPKLTNYSRDWVIMKLRFTVPFETDLHKVKKLFKQIGKDMMEVEEFKGDFIQPFKSQGVLEVNDVGIVLRGKFMAKPGTQFMIRKELYNRVQKAFDENGIQFARKEVRVKLEGDNTEDLSEDEKKLVSGAAAESIQEEMAQPAQEGQDKPGS